MIFREETFVRSLVNKYRTSVCWLVIDVYQYMQYKDMDEVVLYQPCTAPHEPLASLVAERNSVLH